MSYSHIHITKHVKLRFLQRIRRMKLSDINNNTLLGVEQTIKDLVKNSLEIKFTDVRKLVSLKLTKKTKYYLSANQDIIFVCTQKNRKLFVVTLVRLS